MKSTRHLITMAILGLASPAVGSLGVHFPSNRGNARLLPSEVAGVVGFAQRNWNSADGGGNSSANASGNTGNISLPNNGLLTLEDGSTAVNPANSQPTTVEWTSNGTWNTTNGAATPDAKLMNGYIDAVNLGGFSQVSFADIPFSDYIAVVYFGSDGNGRTGKVTDGTTTYSYTTFSNDPNGGGGFDATDYVLTTDTGTSFPEANYAVFSGLTGSSWSVDILRGSNNSGIHAVQLVGTGIVNGIPEPATLSVFAVGIAALGVIGAVRRRRR